MTDTDEDLPTIDDDDDDDEDDYRGSFDEDEDADEDVCSVLPRDKSKADSKNELECKEPKEGKRQPAAGPAEDTLPSGYTRWLGPPGGSMELSEEGAPPAQAAQPVYAVLDRISKDRVAFFNFGTGALVASIDLAQGLAFQLTAPQRMATSLDGRTIAVTNFADGFGGVTNPPHVTVIDAERRSILGRVLLPADEFVEAIEIAPDMRTAYVGAWERIATPPFAANPRILVVDLQTRTVTARIPLPVELAG